ncbi:unnamed protein product [Polarella glacialis]|uniref:Uncharacterized protein n=1 Tax=Polarella glacialis TaxID=89957 RepID=A0A813E4L7_POLGL|nr:unnamed protein product [Polarella glacialis]
MIRPPSKAAFPLQRLSLSPLLPVAGKTGVGFLKTVRIEDRARRVPDVSSLAAAQVATGAAIGQTIRLQGSSRRRRWPKPLKADAASSGRLAYRSTDDAAVQQKLKQAEGDFGSMQAALRSLKDNGDIHLFESYPSKLPRRQLVSLQDLQSVGILAPSRLAEEPDYLGPSVALSLFFGSAAFAASAVLGSQATLSFLVTSLLLMASLASILVGAFAPGLLQGLDKDVRQRAVDHEAAHFLVGYMLGAPIRGYSADAGGRPSVEFDELSGPMAGYRNSKQALEAFCVVACAGIAGEGLLYEGAKGGSADLIALEQVISTASSAAEMGGPQALQDRMNFTRWGVFYAASMLRSHRASWDALRKAMENGGDISDCVWALESAER